MCRYSTCHIHLFPLRILLAKMFSTFPLKQGNAVSAEPKVLLPAFPGSCRVTAESGERLQRGMPLSMARTVTHSAPQFSVKI